MPFMKLFISLFVSSLVMISLGFSTSSRAEGETTLGSVVAVKRTFKVDIKRCAQELKSLGDGPGKSFECRVATFAKGDYDRTVGEPTTLSVETTDAKVYFSAGPYFYIANVYPKTTVLTREVAMQSMQEAYDKLKLDVTELATIVYTVR